MKKFQESIKFLLSFQNEITKDGCFALNVKCPILPQIQGADTLDFWLFQESMLDMAKEDCAKVIPKEYLDDVLFELAGRSDGWLLIAEMDIDFDHLQDLESQDEVHIDEQNEITELANLWQAYLDAYNICKELKTEISKHYQVWAESMLEE